MGDYSIVVYQDGKPFEQNYDDKAEEEEEESNFQDIIFHPKERRSYTHFADDGDLLFPPEYIAEFLWVNYPVLIII